MASTALAQPRPWPATSSTQEGDLEPTRAKRAKIALACQRCKKRKRKCDGVQPCSKCSVHGVECEYVMPTRTMPFDKKRYIENLEARIAELESLIAVHGIQELGNDHWLEQGMDARAPQFQGEDHGEDNSDHESHENRSEISKEANGSESVDSILRSLSLDVNGSGYIGASSHVTLGRLFGFLNLGRKGLSMAAGIENCESNIVQAHDLPMDDHPIDFVVVPFAIADRLFAGFVKHISTRFPVVHSVWVKKLHKFRDKIEDIFEETILHLVYAAAGKFLETAGETGNFAARRHYRASFQSLDAILAYNDIRTVQVLMLMAIYCLRDSVGPGAWTYSRTALLIAIEKGLHRRIKLSEQSSPEYELRKRLFWSCYCFDRQISIPMGRPLGISDRDIDLEKPVDVDEDSSDEQLKYRIPSFNTQARSTSLTSFIRMIHMREIESEIQQTIYRVDRDATVKHDVINHYQRRLQAWRDSIPEDTKHFKDTEGRAYDGHDYYLVFYYKCLRLLLFPAVISPGVNTQTLSECAQACAGVCGTYKRLHQSLAVGYSSMALQTVFMAGKFNALLPGIPRLSSHTGLTLVYCIWLCPDEIFSFATSTGINECSVVLFVITERVPAAKRYRDAFEAIRQQVIDRLADTPGPGINQSMKDLTSELSLEAIDVDDAGLRLDEGSYEQMSRIMAEMAGETCLATDTVSPGRRPLPVFDDDFSKLFDMSGL